MLYLLLATCCSSAIALLFKHSENSGMNRYAVTTVNYVTAVLLSTAMLVGGRFRLPSEFSPGRAFDQLGDALAGGPAPISPDGSLLWAGLAGLGAGLFFFLAFVYYQLAVRDHGVGLAGSFAKLGILVPMSLSLVLWQELPTALQWFGIALAVGSIVIVNWPTGRGLGDALRPALLLLFLFGGIAEFSNKVFQQYGRQDDKAVFLLATFAVACLCSLVVTVRRRRPVARRDIVMGILVGVPNLFSSFFLILALDTVPAAVAFPAFGAGTIVIINAVGVTFFRERLSTREWLAVGLTATALILINLK